MPSVSATEPAARRRRRRSSARSAPLPASVEPMAALPDAVLFKGTVRARDQGGDGPAHRAGQRQPLRRGAHAARAQGARPRRRAAVRAGGRHRQPPVDVGAGRAALCRDADAHRQPRAERLRARRRDVQRQRDRRADDDRQLLQLLHALRRGAEPAGRDVGARRRDDVAGAWPRPAGAEAAHRAARRRRDHGGGRRARAVEGSGRPAGAEQPRPRHGQLAARDAARAGHPAGVARVRQQLPREGHHRPRHPAAGVVRGVDRQRVPLLHAPPGAGAARASASTRSSCRRCARTTRR